MHDASRMRRGREASRADGGGGGTSSQAPVPLVPLAAKPTSPGTSPVALHRPPAKGPPQEPQHPGGALPGRSPQVSSSAPSPTSPPEQRCSSAARRESARARRLVARPCRRLRPLQRRPARHAGRAAPLILPVAAEVEKSERRAGGATEVGGSTPPVAAVVELAARWSFLTCRLPAAQTCWLLGDLAVQRRTTPHRFSSNVAASRLLGWPCRRLSRGCPPPPHSGRLEAQRQSTGSRAYPGRARPPRSGPGVARWKPAVRSRTQGQRAAGLSLPPLRMGGRGGKRMK